MSEVAQSCPTLCNPMDCSLPGSSVHGILQARILEWVAISFSRGSSRPRDRTQVSCIVGRRVVELGLKSRPVWLHSPTAIQHCKVQLSQLYSSYLPLQRPHFLISQGLYFFFFFIGCCKHQIRQCM